MKKIIFIIILFFLYAISGFGRLSAGTGDNDGFKWKIDDLLTGDRVVDYRISPDSKKILWIVGKWDLKTQKRYNVIRLSEFDSAKVRRLTRNRNRYFSPRWIPGKNRISFKTDRKFPKTKKNNIWVMDLGGGEPWPVTNFKKGVGIYEWVDENTLIYTSRESDSLFEMEKKKNKDTSVVVEDEDHRIPYRLFRYNLKTGIKERLTDNKKPVTSFSLSPKKDKIIYSVSLSMLYTQDQEVRPAFYLYDLKTGEKREIFKERDLKPAGIFSWSPDESGFYSVVSYSTHPKYTMAAVNRIYYYHIKEGKRTEIDLHWDRYSGWNIAPLDNGFIVPLLNGVHYKYARFYKKGKTWKRRWIDGDLQKNIRSLKVAPDGRRVVFSFSTASLPQRYYLGKLKGTKIEKEKEIMKLNYPLFKKPLARTEIVKWTGALNDEIEGILYYPINYKKGKRYPLIVMIHGGPNGADMDFFSDRLAYPAHLMAERGAFSLKINYHGSSNYGIEFGESIAGHYYEYEVPDIEKGVDSLIEKGLVDKERLGIIGWSNGAILGTALNITTNRYKVASLGAGDVNWTSDYGNCAFGVAFDNYYFGGPPWEKVDHYIKKSPLFRLKSVVTPTLIFHGTKDRSVPYEQGWEYYRALKVIGKVPVRFVSFPGEGHGPRKLAHQRRKLKEEIDWFDRYLFKTFRERNEAMKKGSPLDKLSGYLKIKKTDGLYGVMKGGHLIPEIIGYKKMNIGRFEVTRAQWAEFDKNYKYKKGMGNYPVTGISIRKVKNYLKWLGKVTGNKFRLPGKKESIILYKKRGGNVLDYWAGYKLNPDDCRKLKKEILKFKADMLLKPVGSFRPEGNEFVFDLGGNAAELVYFNENLIKPSGGSADRAADLTVKTEPGDSFTGFRVVREN